MKEGRQPQHASRNTLGEYHHIFTSHLYITSPHHLVQGALLRTTMCLSKRIKASIPFLLVLLAGDIQLNPGLGLVDTPVDNMTGLLSHQQGVFPTLDTTALITSTPHGIPTGFLTLSTSEAPAGLRGSASRAASLAVGSISMVGHPPGNNGSTPRASNLAAELYSTPTDLLAAQLATAGLRGSALRAASLAVGPPTGSNEGPPRASGPAAESCPPSVAGPSAHLFSDLARIAVSKWLNCVHLNVRSLLPKIDEICLFAFNARVGVICITESWLDPSISDSEIELSNYTVVRRDRSRKGGGVCAFVRNDIDFTVRTIWDEDIEV